MTAKFENQDMLTFPVVTCSLSISDNATYKVFRREIEILLRPFTIYWEDQIGKFFSHEIISTAGVCCQPTYSGGTVSLCRDQVAQLTSENPQQLTHQRASKDI